MFNSIDTWIKANPYLTKLIVGALAGLLGWQSHRAVVPSPVPVPVPVVSK